MFQKLKFPLLGLATGVLNGLFGAGGGMVAVPMLKTTGIPASKSHATSIAIILPLCVASGIIYLVSGSVALSDAWIYLPGGVTGAVVGGYLLPRIKTALLRRIFGILILYSAIRLLLR